ncbi:hypothetical protein [Nonomuraea lactucae]|uniref:hypothetical protein n=1 Tax=Nonomuraea lactucae TaxID=2249762 RepID=UPI0013B45B4C|nr:hypothetical protein [Nonomuraea lactucae]
MSATLPGTVLDVFEERMLDVWERGRFEVSDPQGTARLIHLLLEREGFTTTASVLAESGIRSQWNRVLAEERSNFLASWLRPYLEAPVLDVLGGDFSVLRALVTAGLPADGVVGCERLHAYEVDWAAQPFLVHDVAAEVALPQGPFRSLLVSAVLHHEPDPGRLLDAAARTGAGRWVVVENCVDESNTDAFHRYVDEFFNRCLNTFDVPCVDQHRTATQWRELLGGFGRVVHEETRADVPGMPFPYTLLVVDR